jgi:TolA-binding protein
MATAKITKKAMQQDEFIDGMFDMGEWLEIHWQRVAIVGGVAAVLVLVGIGWNSMRQGAAEEASRLLGAGIEAYAPAAGADGQSPEPRYSEALTLFEQAAAKGGSQGVGDVARFFKARTLLALSRGSEAVPVLEGLVAGGNPSLASEAKVSLAEAVEASGNADRAAALLHEVESSEEKGTYPRDGALMLLGGLYERQGKKDEAKRTYDDLLARFPQSPFASDARQRSGAPAEKPR